MEMTPVDSIQRPFITKGEGPSHPETEIIAFVIYMLKNIENKLPVIQWFAVLYRRQVLYRGFFTGPTHKVLSIEDGKQNPY